MLKTRFLPVLAFLIPLSACGDDTKSKADATDTTAPSDAAQDVASDIAEDVAPDTADTAADAHDEDVPTQVDELGFTIRAPQLRTVPRETRDGTIESTEAEDIDHVCKVAVAGFDGHIYVRANPVQCYEFGSCDFTVSGAWQKVGDVITPLAGADYNFGGNHHNDAISFPHGVQTLKLYHSSFGYGFRACQRPDCAQVYAGDTLVTDGCTTDRTLPVTCVRIEDDGTEPPLVDAFEKCAGDPNLE